MFDTGYRRSPADHRDWNYRAVAMATRSARGVKIPERFRVDKRTPLPVYEQQGPSCMGWSMATAKTSQERFDKRRTVRFDGQSFYAKIALPGGGAYPRDALRLAIEEGVPDEKGKLHRIGGFAAVNPRDHDAVKHAIVTGRGLLIGFEVTRQWADGGGAEFQDTGSEVLGGHAMFVPGYDPAGPEGLNTWSERWGRGGRATLPWSYWDQRVWEAWTLLDVND